MLEAFAPIYCQLPTAKHTSNALQYLEAIIASERFDELQGSISCHKDFPHSGR